jgi:hypothetical protein
MPSLPKLRKQRPGEGGAARVCGLPRGGAPTVVLNRKETPPEFFQMRLPNGEAAIIDMRKILHYCLSKEHPRGKHKALVFERALGMTDEHSDELRDALKLAALERDATIGSSDRYGTRYIIDFELERGNRRGFVRSCWIIRSGEKQPRFVTSFVL